MTAARTDHSADELILDRLARRLAAIDDELPRLRPWRPDRIAAGQLHVVRGRTRRIGAVRRSDGIRPGTRIRLDVAGAAMAAVIAVAVLAAGRGSDVGRPLGVTAPTPPGPAFSFGPDGSSGSAAASGAPTPASTHPAPTPTPTRTRPPGVRPTPGGPGATPSSDAVEPVGLQAVLGRMGWRCGVLVEVALDPLGGALLDKLAATAGRNGSFVPAELGAGWVGSDPQQAARAFKGRALLTDAVGSLWVLRGDGASAVVLQVVPERAASGAAVWRSADILWPAACLPVGTDPKVLAAGRAPSDWPAGRIVNIRAVRLGRLATAAGHPL